MKRFSIIAGLLSLVLLASAKQAGTQQPAEPNRIQKTAFAKPIDKSAAPETPTVDVPVQQLGKQYRLLGKLNLPLGEVARVQGLIVPPGPAKTYDNGLSVRVFRINGVATQEFIQIKLVDYYGRDEVPVKPGTTCDLEGFETGGFVGVPVEAVQRGGAVAATASHHFAHEFKVIQASETKLQPFTPADFLGREMLVQGQAVSEGGSAYIFGNKWKLLVDNGTPWPKSTESKTVEARGVIRTIGKTATYRLENGGKTNNAHLINLADQVGKVVTLRGYVVNKNDDFWFRYRGQSLAVEGLQNLFAQAGLPQDVQLTGTLLAEQVTSQLADGGTETRTAYVVRKASLKATDPLLAIERAEPAE